MYLGAHVSIAKSIALAPERGRSIGCEAIQIFTKNQMQWKTRDLSAEEAEGFRENLKASGMNSAIAHDSYLINLGSSSEDLWKKSVESLKHEAERCDALGIECLVMHPGANADESEGIKNIVKGLNQVLESSRTTVLLEITAGQGNSIGHGFEQLARVTEQVDYRERVGVCFDTCHAYAAGYDVKNKYHEVMDELDDVLGLEKLRALHLNDSRGSLGSHLDRHENIGRGALGTETFRQIVNDRKLSEIPGILETPGGDEDFRMNLEILKSLRSGKVF
jgi:deoxyribonuclease-4